VKADSNIYKLIVSEQTATRLQLKTGDKISAYFATQINGSSQLLVRNCFITGIYKSGLTDFDKNYALCSLHLLQRINKWPDDRVTGYEIFLDRDVNEDDMEETAKNIHENYISNFLSAKALPDLYPNLFDWLALQKTNELIIIILMTLVAIVNLVTMLLILILERSRFIGVMKALGARTITLTSVFIYQSAYVVLAGMLIGNVLGFSLCLIQHFTHFITLDEETYFVSYAPIYFDWPYILFINVIVFVVAMLTLLLPTFVITKIQPSKVLRFS
jgi:lipoprotein-releasing system permease protein